MPGVEYPEDGEHRWIAHPPIGTTAREADVVGAGRYFEIRDHVRRDELTATRVAGSIGGELGHRRRRLRHWNPGSKRSSCSPSILTTAGLCTLLIRISPVNRAWRGLAAIQGPQLVASLFLAVTYRDLCIPGERRRRPRFGGLRAFAMARSCRAVSVMERYRSRVCS